jgi:hypothetical protein
MKQTINLSQFRDAFNRMDRGSQFSYEGLEVLFDYFEQYEQEFEEELELDVIAICCEYSEMTIQEIIDSYDIEVDYSEDVYSQVLDYLEHRTVIVGDTSKSTIIFAQF